MTAISRQAVEELLSRLCTDLGFCLPPHEKKRLAEKPPTNVREFTDAVFQAEGLDPTVADQHLYRQVRDLIAEGFVGNGLPREGDA